MKITDVNLVSVVQSTAKQIIVRPTLLPERFVSITKVSDFPVVSEEYNSISAPKKIMNSYDLK